MKLNFILMVLFFNVTYSQQLERKPALDDYPDWAHVTFAKQKPTRLRNTSSSSRFQFGPTINPRALAIELFRSKFCTQITQKVPKNEFIVHNRLFSVSRYAAAKFSWDIISYAFIHAMRGKEIDQIWYPAFTQACTNVVQHHIAEALCIIVPKKVLSKKEQNDIKLQICQIIKDQSRSLIAQGLVMCTTEYVFPIIKKQSVTVLQSIFAKKH